MRRSLCLALVFLLATSVQASDPNPRTPQSFEHPVTAIALSGDGSHVAVGLQDEGGVLSNDRSQEVWNLLEVQTVGLKDRQGGDADDGDCTSPLQLEDMCRNSVAAVALSQDGRRLVVAAPGTDDDTTLVFAHAVRGEDDRFVVPGEVTALAMNDDGSRVIVALDTGGAGNVRYYDVSTSANLRWDHDTDDPVTGLAFSRDGERAIAAAGGQVIHFQRAASVSPFVDALSSGTVRSVAISDNNEHHAVAGISTGAYRLYSDTSVASQTVEANIRGTGSVDQVAIDPAGAHIVLARAGGLLEVLSIVKTDVGIHVGDRIADVTLDSPARGVRISGNGEHVLVREDQVLSHRTMALETMWSTPIEQEGEALAIVDAAISDDGDRIIALAGDDLHIFDAIVDLHVAMQHPGPLLPGQEVEVAVTVRNDGNRVENVELDVEGPSNWGANISARSLRLLPDDTARLDLQFRVPDHGAPGAYDLHLIVESAQGSATRELAMEVLTVERWSLQPGSNPTSLSVQAGQRATYTLAASNEGNVAGPPPVDLEVLTSGWQGDVVLPDGAISAGGTEDVFVRLKAPDQAEELAVGEARIRIDQGEWIRLTATVGASFDVQFDGPGRVDVQAGEPSEVVYTVQNAGNAPDAFRLRLSSVPSGWDVNWNGLGQEVVTGQLAPGESLQRTLRITVPAGAESQNVEITLTAQSLADDEVQRSRSLVLQVEGDGAATEEPPDKKDPGFALLAGLAAVAAAVVLRRRT